MTQELDLFAAYAVGLCVTRLVSGTCISCEALGAPRARHASAALGQLVGGRLACSQAAGEHMLPLCSRSLLYSYGAVLAQGIAGRSEAMRPAGLGSREMPTCKAGASLAARCSVPKPLRVLGVGGRRLPGGVRLTRGRGWPCWAGGLRRFELSQVSSVKPRGLLLEQPRVGHSQSVFTYNCFDIIACGMML